MIDPGAGKIPLIAHSENSFTMEGTGVEFVRMQKAQSPQWSSTGQRAIGISPAGGNLRRQLESYR